jgi:hypothetical protein
MDVMGAIRGWRYVLPRALDGFRSRVDVVDRYLDHWAHLGGAAFGAVYYAYGPTFWTFMRRSHQSIQQHAKEGGS